MPRPHIEPYDERPAAYKRMTLPGFSKGMHYKVLSMDVDSGACSLKVKFEGGYKLPPGMSYSELEMFIVSGSITYGDTNYGEGHYFLIPPGVSMPAMSVSRGAVAIMFYNYGEPSFVEHDSARSSAHTHCGHGNTWGNEKIMSFTVIGIAVGNGTGNNEHFQLRVTHPGW